MKLYYWSIISTLILSAFLNNPEYSVKVSKQEASALALQIRNYEQFDFNERKYLSEEIFYWENSAEVTKLKSESRLPHSLVHIATKPLEVNPILPSPFENRPVCWLPKLSLFYELMVVHENMLQFYGEEKCPSVFLVMALLSHETYMRDIKGDGQLSIGMCQLYKPTARYLVEDSRNKDTFRKLIFFDENDRHHFYSQKSMLEFVYHFLILEKGYVHNNPKKGVKAYNGAGKAADKYASNVLLKSMFYEALSLKLKQNEPTLALKDLKEWTKAPLRNTFIDFNGFQLDQKADSENKSKHLSEKEIKKFQNLKYSIAQYVSEIDIPEVKAEQLLIPDNEIQIRLEKVFEKAQPLNHNNQKPLQKERRYFILEQNRSVYSYLRENTYKVLTTCNSYYFYTVKNEEKKRLNSEKELQKALIDKQIVLSSAAVGDTIYFDHYPIFNLR